MRFVRSHQDEDNERIYTIQQGHCEKGICGNEAACQMNPNGTTFVCICPHDRQPPTKHGKCPTRRTVPLDPRKIENILPPQNNDTKTALNDTWPQTTRQPVTMIPTGLSSSEPPPSTALDVPLEQQQFSAVSAIGVVTAIAFLILCTCLLLWRRTRSCQRQRKTSTTPSPLALKHNLLLPERYAPNPQYTVCSNSSVQQLMRAQINFLAEIGEGCFGKVYKGELFKENSDTAVIVAVKVLKESASREAEEDFLREVDIMSAFRHVNILTLVGVVFRDSNINPMMVFEFMCHGDLAEVLRNQSKRPEDERKPLILTRSDLMDIALQIASGMLYLASQRFVHRDLACRNCLVSDGPVVKIADFGMSRDVYTCDYYKVGGSRLLPVRWMSPESTLYGRFTLESDIWSFGIVLWEIFTFGKQPYYGHSNDEVIKLVLQGIMLIAPDDCPPVICELMKQCWKTEPRDRIKFAGICDILEVAYKDYKDTSNSERASILRTMSLPRPPPLAIHTAANVLPKVEDLLDTDGYLLPKDIKEPVQYLQTCAV